jgi:hypothetical protein
MLKKIAEDELALASDEHTNEDTVAGYSGSEAHPSSGFF